MPTKIYLNTSATDLKVLGIGDIPAGEQVSITSEFLPPVILENYPGLQDVTDAGASTEQAAPDRAVSAPQDQPSLPQESSTPQQEDPNNA